MRTITILFLSGILCLLQFSRLPPISPLFILPLLLLLTSRSLWLRWPAWIVCGFLWALFHADARLAERLDRQLEGQAVVVEGRIVSLPVEMGIATRFEFAIDKLLDGQGRTWPSPVKVRLSWYRQRPALVPGESWRLRVKLKRPYGFMNPGGFDYEGWLFQNGIGANGYVLDNAANRRLRAASGQYANRIRYNLRERIDQFITSQPGNALTQALTVGDRGAMTPEQWRVLTHTGTNHLLAISGLHIGFIAGLTFFIVRWVWPLLGLSALRIASPKAAALAAMAAAAVYAALAGFSIPTQRALIMLGVLMVLSLFSRHAGTTHLMAVALLSILLIDPFAPMAPGFWLSFAAIAVIAYGMANRVGNRGIWWRWGRVQYLVALGLVPLLILWFNQVPLLSIAANSIAVPWVSLLTVPLLLGGVILLLLNDTAGRWLLELGADTLDLIWLFLKAIAGLKLTMIPVAAPTLLILAAGVAGISLILMPKGMPGRWLGIIWLLPLFFAQPSWQQRRGFTLILLDVGQGLAAVVKTRKHTLLYDTGPRYSSRFNAGSGVILPYLRHAGVPRVDLLIQGHGDSDHIGGLDDILAGIQVDGIVTSVPERIDYPGTRPCQVGQRWRWDGVLFEVLHPRQGSRLQGNNRSCVLRVSYRGEAVLLTGDIEKAGEEALLIAAGEDLIAQVIVAPHHGSRTSSTPGLLAQVRPQIVLFPVGYRNRFGFPKEDIIERYRQQGAAILDTARSGAIEVHFQGNGIQLIRHRRRLRRFWHTLY